MSNRSELRRLPWGTLTLPLTLALVVVLALPGAASSEITAKPAPSAPSSARTKPTPVESMARISDDAPRTVLKCWQEGRLVFESAGMQLVAESASASAPTLKGSDGRLVQLFDLRQGLCVFERSRG